MPIVTPGLEIGAELMENNEPICSHLSDATMPIVDAKVGIVALFGVDFGIFFRI